MSIVLCSLHSSHITTMSNFTLPIHVKPEGTAAPKGQPPDSQDHDDAAEKVTTLSSPSHVCHLQLTHRQLLTAKLAFLSSITSAWSLHPATSPLTASIAPQTRTGLTNVQSGLANLATRATMDSATRPSLETILWSRSLLEQLQKLSKMTEREYAWATLENVVHDRQEGLTGVTGPSTLVRECLPADVKEAMRRVKYAKRVNGQG
ncbi:hypothetical protein BKA63DRAFT_141596 [Paraphoma chrysanthemicola]|nr:hypothetical protein BKA63DRAFT_141596 [Paraphoma chrysanthemicola]